MIKKIDSNQILSSLIEDTCCENGVCISFDAKVPPNAYRIIKVDKYYNSLNITNRPASVDCLIVRKCNVNSYGLTLVELKNIDNSKGFTIENMKAKFETTLYDFIGVKFKNPLLINYKDVKLYFVSNKEIHKRDLGLKMEVLMNISFSFQEKRYMIRPKMPTPTIKNCY